MTIQSYCGKRSFPWYLLFEDRLWKSTKSLSVFPGFNTYQILTLSQYGAEHCFTGPPHMNADDDQSAREVMWKSGYKITPLYQYIALLNRVRKLSWSAGFGSNLATAVGTNNKVAAIQKGPLLMVLSNEGSDSTPNRISVNTTFPTGTVLVNVLTGKSIAVKNSTYVTVMQGQPQIYVPYPLATKVCSNITPPPTSFAAKIYRLCFPKANKFESSTTFWWSEGAPAITHDIVKPALVDVSAGKILQPSPASMSSPYSIFCANSRDPSQPQME